MNEGTERAQGSPRPGTADVRFPCRQMLWKLLQSTTGTSPNSEAAFPTQKLNAEQQEKGEDRFSFAAGDYGSIRHAPHAASFR